MNAMNSAVTRAADAIHEAYHGQTTRAAAENQARLVLGAAFGATADLVDDADTNRADAREAAAGHRYDAAAVLLLDAIAGTLTDIAMSLRMAAKGADDE